MQQADKETQTALLNCVHGQCKLCGHAKCVRTSPRTSHRTSLCTLTPPDVSDVPDVTGCSGRMSDAPDAATHVNIQNPLDASDAHRTPTRTHTGRIGRTGRRKTDAHRTLNRTHTRRTPDVTGRHRTSPDVPDVPDAQGSEYLDTLTFSARCFASVRR